MSKTSKHFHNIPPPVTLPAASQELRSSFLEYFTRPEQFANLVNNTLLLEHGLAPLIPKNLAPLNVRAGSYRFPAECWEQPTILMGVYEEGLPKTIDSLRTVFSLSCLAEPSDEELIRQMCIVSSVHRWSMEAGKDAEYQKALSQWKAEAGSAKSRGEPIPRKPIRRVEDGPDDQVVSCVPVVLYVGATLWTAATTTKDLLKPDPGAGYGDLAFPFRYHLIDPHRTPESVFSRCGTDVGLLLKTLKHHEDAAMMDQFCRDPKLDPIFRKLCKAVGKLVSGPALSAAANLRDSFLAYLAQPEQFADLVNNTFLLENGAPPLDHHDLAPLDLRASSYRFPIECWEQPTILMGVYRAGQPKTIGNLQTVFSLSCLTEPSVMEITRQGRIGVSVDTWRREATKDAEYQAALSQWKADADTAKSRNEPVPQKPVRRLEDGPGDQGVTVVPMVLYVGAAPWTVPTSTKDMVPQGNVFGEYGVTLFFHLLDPHRLPDSTISHCSTDVGLVLKAIKYRDNAAIMDQLRHDPALLKAGNDAISFLNAVADTGLAM